MYAEVRGSADQDAFGSARVRCERLPAKKRDPVKHEAKQDLRSLSTQPDVSVHQPVQSLSAFGQFGQVTFLEGLRERVEQTPDTSTIKG